ncbi:MAG: FtsW/RodA/SpoVE family cell cycle protein [Lachnospiraceae bacterium]
MAKQNRVPVKRPKQPQTAKAMSQSRSGSDQGRQAVNRQGGQPSASRPAGYPSASRQGGYRPESQYPRLKDPRQVQAAPKERPPRPAAPVPEKKRKEKPRRFYDYSLLFTIVFLTIFGLIMIYSASSYKAQLTYDGDAAYFMRRQGYIAAGSFVLMLIISKIDYHVFARFAKLGYVVSIILMIAVALVGREVNGKKRWLGIGPISFQPTELVKIALILVLAVYITKIGNQINTRKGVLHIFLLTLPLAVLVGANNLSSGIIIMGIAVVMLFVSHKNKGWFFGIGALGIAAMAGAGPMAVFLEKIGFLKPYQANRIFVWLNPEAYPQDGGFQVLQGLYAIGSGGLLGKGLGESIQKLGFVPEAQNDMIFSIICEELGLFGAVSVILIFLFMIYRFMIIASNAPDLLGALLVVGVMGHIAIQVVLNIAVVTNTIPNTGITLPFVSYGGTSVLFLMAEMGMVLSVSNQIKLEK